MLYRYAPFESCTGCSVSSFTNGEPSLRTLVMRSRHAVRCRTPVTIWLSAAPSVCVPCRKRQFCPTASSTLQPVSLAKPLLANEIGSIGVVMSTTIAASLTLPSSPHRASHQLWPAVDGGGKLIALASAFRDGHTHWPAAPSALLGVSTTGTAICFGSIWISLLILRRASVMIFCPASEARPALPHGPESCSRPVRSSWKPTQKRRRPSESPTKRIVSKFSNGSPLLR